jgi:hypothetical protein
MGDLGKNGPLQRSLVEVKMPEAGPVVFPAYSETSVSVRAAELAKTVTTDHRLMQEVRSALVLGAARGGKVELPDDAALRSDIARAVLFGTRSTVRDGRVLLIPAQPWKASTTRQDAPLTTEHPAAGGTDADLEADTDSTEDDEQDENSTTDAPADGHPSGEDGEQAEGRSSGENDAPADDGHPSGATTQADRQRAARLAYVTRNRVGKKY